jgi:hypothetical protein
MPGSFIAQVVYCPTCAHRVSCTHPNPLGHNDRRPCDPGYVEQAGCPECLNRECLLVRTQTERDGFMAGFLSAMEMLLKRMDPGEVDALIEASSLRNSSSIEDKHA